MQLDVDLDFPLRTVERALPDFMIPVGFLPGLELLTLLDFPSGPKVSESACNQRALQDTFVMYAIKFKS